MSENVESVVPTDEDDPTDNTFSLQFELINEQSVPVLFANFVNSFHDGNSGVFYITFAQTIPPSNAERLVRETEGSIPRIQAPIVGRVVMPEEKFLEWVRSIMTVHASLINLEGSSGDE